MNMLPKEGVYDIFKLWKAWGSDVPNLNVAI